MAYQPYERQIRISLATISYSLQDRKKGVGYFDQAKPAILRILEDTKD